MNNKNAFGNIKKVLLLLLCFGIILCTLSACKKSGSKIILGKWYNYSGDCLEIQSDNTYRTDFVEEIGTTIGSGSGKWTYLEEENIFKFYSNDGKVWEISISEDKYGKNFEYSYYGIFYKNEFPLELIEDKKKLEEEQYLKSTTECPNFVGLTIEKVKEHEFYNDFEIHWEYVANEEYDIGIVCDQSETAAKRLKKGSTITLYISTGWTQIKVPDVYGKTESYAVSELKSKGFIVNVIEISDSDFETGLVIKTDPVRTTVVPKGSKITVYVSVEK